MFSIKVCECNNNHGDTVKKEDITIRESYGVVETTPNSYGLKFCAHCDKALTSKERAREIIRGLVETKQRSLGFLTSSEVRGLRAQTEMSVRTFGEFVKVNYATISAIENGYAIQNKTSDQVIRTKAEAYIKRNAPERKKVKKIFSHMIQTVGTSKLFLNKMMFYVDFWNFKRSGKSLTGGNYTPLQYGPCPVDYHEILQEMIADGDITAIEGHRFRVNKTPDMSEFSVEEMESINDIIKLAKNDKGQKLFDLSHEERGFIETPLYETISYEKYAKDLKIEELLNEITETG